MKLFGKWLFSGFQHFRLKTVGSQILGKVHFFGHFSCKHDCSCVRHLSWAHDNRESHTSAYCLRSRHLRLGAGQYAIIRLSAKQSRSSRKRVTLISRFGKHSHSFTIVSETKFGTLVLGGLGRKISTQLDTQSIRNFSQLPLSATFVLGD